MMARNLRYGLAVVAMSLMVPAAAQAAPITGLFNTGVDAAGNALPGGSNDPHYAILAPAQPGVVISTPAGTWLSNTATRRWIWQNANGQPTNTTLTFRTTFDLSGLDPTTAAISGQWATDNSGLDILINGASTGNTCGGFSALCGFSVLSGFVAGTNTLDFVVRDFGVISGFLVSSIAGTADAAVQTPEPAAAALFGAGLVVMGLVRRRRRRAA